MLYVHKCSTIADLFLTGWRAAGTLLVLLSSLHTSVYAAGILEPQQSAWTFLAESPCAPSYRTLPDPRPDFKPCAETSVQVDLRVPVDLSRALQQEGEMARSVELRVPAVLRDRLLLEEHVQ
jgi:hypothetical protein